MREDERKIATRLLKDGLARGWRAAIHDEEGLAVAGRKLELLVLELGATDGQQVLFYEDHMGDPQDNGPCVGTVSLVYGNEPGVLMSDSGGTKEFDEFLASIEAYQERFQK